MKSKDLVLISVYRSSGGSQKDLLESIKSMLEDGFPTMICGDFNLCSLEERSKTFLESLKSIGFEEKVQKATHIKGGNIDHVYFKDPSHNFDLDMMLYSPYYPIMDHDAICSTITMFL